MTAGPFIVSPFGTYTLTGGAWNTEMTSSMSFGYPSASGSIDPEGSIVVGFDVLYVPKGITLSSQLRANDSYTLISVALMWLL